MHADRQRGDNGQHHPRSLRWRFHGSRSVHDGGRRNLRQPFDGGQQLWHGHSRSSCGNVRHERWKGDEQHCHGQRFPGRWHILERHVLSQRGRSILQQHGDRLRRRHVYRARLNHVREEHLGNRKPSENRWRDLVLQHRHQPSRIQHHQQLCDFRQHRHGYQRRK